MRTVRRDREVDGWMEIWAGPRGKQAVFIGEVFVS